MIAGDRANGGSSTTVELERVDLCEKNAQEYSAARVSDVVVLCLVGGGDG
jgi:hypothetical protein